MSDDIQVTYGDELSPEQKERLEAIEAEEGKVEEPKEEPLTEEKPEETPEPAEEPSKKEEVVNDDEPDEDEEPEVEGEKPTRMSKFVNLDKHLKMRDRAKQAEEELEKLRSEKASFTAKPTEQTAEDLRSSIDEYADEFGVSKDSVEKLLRLAEEGATKKVQSELGEKLKQFEEATKAVREAEQDATQEKLWRKDLESLKEKYPTEDVDSIRGKLKRHYFSEEFSKTPIDVIYRGVEGLRATSKKTVEKGKGGTSKDTPVVDFKKILEDNNQEAIQAMDTKTFGEFRDYVAKHKV